MVKEVELKTLDAATAHGPPRSLLKIDAALAELLNEAPWFHWPVEIQGMC